jgi:hypothetical protein
MHSGVDETCHTTNRLANCCNDSKSRATCNIFQMCHRTCSTMYHQVRAHSKSLMLAMHRYHRRDSAVLPIKLGANGTPTKHAAVKKPAHITHHASSKDQDPTYGFKCAPGAARSGSHCMPTRDCKCHHCRRRLTTTLWSKENRGSTAQRQHRPQAAGR